MLEMIVSERNRTYPRVGTLVWNERVRRQRRSPTSAAYGKSYLPMLTPAVSITAQTFLLPSIGSSPRVYLTRLCAEESWCSCSRAEECRVYESIRVICGGGEDRK
jgi:hypothetical protein